MVQYELDFSKASEQELAEVRQLLMQVHCIKYAGDIEFFCAGQRWRVPQAFVQEKLNKGESNGKKR